MSFPRILAASLLLLGSADAVAQEHSHAADSTRFTIGAHAVGLVTHATPATYQRNLTEAYVTQPNLFAHASFLDGLLTAQATINFEGLTLERGELNAGTWGEGYIDRRHPHTYLHEALITARTNFAGFDASITAGRGFAPFGSDDPMVRPFVKFPANHHLAQVLERWMLMGVLRRGPVIVEAGLFNGDEPTGPDDTGRFDRFADSWSTRITLAPVPGLEVFGSYAFVTSPELPWGGGLDQDKRHAGVRYARQFASGTRLYALAEVMRTADVRFSERTHGHEDVYVFRGLLAEAEVRHRRWRAAARFERATRPEEERTDNPFRSPTPHADLRIHGINRFTTVSAAIGREAELGTVTVAPFIEVSRSRVTPVLDPALFTPEELWGTSTLWGLSAGVRVGIGSIHERMGRYGAAQLPD